MKRREKAMKQRNERLEKLDKLIEEAKSKSDLEFEKELTNALFNLFDKLDTQALIVIEKVGRNIAMFDNGITFAAMVSAITDLFLNHPDLETEVMTAVFNFKLNETNPNEETLTIH